MATPKQTDPQFKLRMTPEIKEAVEAAASANKRSMNAEILARLEVSQRIEELEKENAFLEMKNRFLTKDVAKLTKKLESYEANIDPASKEAEQELIKTVNTRFSALEAELTQTLHEAVEALRSLGVSDTPTKPDE